MADVAHAAPAPPPPLRFNAPAPGGGAALVSWPPGHRKPSVRDLGGVTHPGALWGGFWGVVLALIFLTPLARPTVRAPAGGVLGRAAPAVFAPPPGAPAVGRRGGRDRGQPGGFRCRGRLGQAGPRRRH